MKTIKDFTPEIQNKISKKYIAASERSGSFHALFGNYDMYEDEQNNIVLDVKEECILNHSLETLLKESGISLDTKEILEKKDHRHTVIPKGFYMVGIQQRFDPLEGIKKRVQD